MASEDLFEEDFSEDILNELDEDLHEDIEAEESFEENGIEEDDTEDPANAGDDLPESSEHETNSNSGSIKDIDSAQSKLFNLPLARVRNIMKLDPDLHTAKSDAVFLMTRATELFIQSLAREAYSFTAQAEKKTLQKQDVVTAINEVDALMFLDGAMNFS